MKADIKDDELYESQLERDARQRYRRLVAIGQIGVVLAVIGFWQFGSGTLMDPFFVGSPLGTAA